MAEAQTLHCPRCKDSILALLGEDSMERHHCDSCDGDWVDHEELQRVLTTVDADDGDPMGEPTKSHGLACPVCAKTMATLRAQSSAGDLSVDVCDPHGVWFDCAELGAMLQVKSREQGSLPALVAIPGVGLAIDSMIRWFRGSKPRG